MRTRVRHIEIPTRMKVCDSVWISLPFSRYAGCIDGGLLRNSNVEKGLVEFDAFEQPRIQNESGRTFRFLYNRAVPKEL